MGKNTKICIISIKIECKNDQNNFSKKLYHFEQKFDVFRNENFLNENNEKLTR